MVPDKVVSHAKGPAMFDEGQLYSPVTEHADGRVEVHLGADHPGFTDAAYRGRRGEIAAAALAWTPGTPIPVIDLHRCRERGLADCQRRTRPQARRACPLQATSPRRPPSTCRPTASPNSRGQCSPAALTGWTYACAPAWSPCAEFYGALGARVFHSTQYPAPPSQPLYTPADIIHEVIGHANQLASPRFARLTEAAGRASLRVQTDAAMKVIADVFWFSMEFGVMREQGELKAYGAGILSSYGGWMPSRTWRSGRSISRRWPASITTSRPTSRRSSAPNRSMSSRTSSASSSRRSTTTHQRIDAAWARELASH